MILQSIPNHGLSLYEAFCHIREHAKEGIESKDGSQCLYRGPNGSACFVGCLLPDDVYSKRLELLSAFDDPVDGAIENVVNEPSRSVREDFFGQLQAIHDDFSPKEWDYLLEEFRKQHFPNLP